MNAQETITTDDLAQTLGTISKTLLKNFQRHLEDFKENVHYVLGKDKSYLWTIQGVFTHAWILKTAPAKAACEKLIDRVEQPKIDVVSLQEYQQLQEQLTLTQAALVQTLEIQNLKHGLDYTQLEEVEMLVEKIQANHQNVEKLMTLCRKLGNLLTLNLDQLEKVDGQFVQQASTLRNLAPVLPQKLLN